MNEHVNDQTLCPNCRKPMPPGALSGLCPACLLVQGMATESEQPGGRVHFQAPPVEEIAGLFPQLEIIELLGAGGMGAVYRARQPVLDRFVALKVLPCTSNSGVNFAERFNREARALARLSHPNIVTVHEFGEVGGLHFFIMEFVDGANLRQLERAGRLSPREALQIIPQICDALQYAHDQGVVHRDIKPENVLVDRKSRIKIADFGLAKILSCSIESSRLTAEGQVMGTPHYMAPEQIEHPLAVDHRADIYSLGVVFYEMLTGELPLGKFYPPSRKVQVHVGLDEVVLRALEKDPERRYQKASEVKSQVETIGNSSPENPPASSRERVASGPLRSDASNRPWWRKNAFAVATVLILILGWVLKTSSLPALVRNRFDPGRFKVAQTAERDAESGRLVAHLPAGGTVELLAVGRPGAALNNWWSADGSAWTNAGFSIHNPSDYSVSGLSSRDVLFHISDLPSGASMAGWRAEPESGYGSGGLVFRHGQPFSGAHQVRFGWEQSVRQADIHYGLALEPWRTIATITASGRNQNQKRLPADPFWIVNFHQEPTDTTHGAQVALVFGPESPMWVHRLVAIDTNGVQRSANRVQGTPIEKVTLWSYTFHGLPLAQAQEFHVQVRSVHWVRFPNVALHPKTPLPPPRRLHWSEVIERRFHELVDFDTGETAEFPTQFSDQNPLKDIGGNVIWAQENGFDAEAGTGELHTLGVDFSLATNEDWETLTPDAAIDQLHQGTFRPRTLKPVQDEKLPVTFAFRTRENGFGLIRLLAFDPDRPGATIQLKRVEWPDRVGAHPRILPNHPR